MIDKSIAYRLSLYISVAVISVFIVFIVAYFLLNQRLLRENIENKAVGLNAEVNSLINRQIVSTKEVTENIALQFNYYNRHDYVETLLTSVSKRYPFISSVHVVLLNKEANPSRHFFIINENSNNQKYGENEHPIFSSSAEERLFKKITREDSSGWTDPYYDLNSDKVYVTYYYPIFTAENQDNPLITGYVISHFSLTGLSESINRMMDSESRGYAFLIDEKGYYLTHPDKDLILKSNITSLSSKIVRYAPKDLIAVFAQRQKGTVIAYPEPLDFEKSWVHYSPINEIGWFLLYVMPHKELFKELYGVTYWMILFAFLGIILIFSFIKIITRKQIEPLKDVASRLTLFSSQGEEITIQSKNEVRQVADSLEFLRNWFSEYQITREKEEQSSLMYRQDLQQASEIQQSLIKTSFPAFPHRKEVDLYAIYKPARVVSGDLFDCFFIDEENLLLSIGDVSGKGVPAAIFMSVAQTIIKNNAALKKPKKIVEKTNSELYTSNHHQYFLTLFLGVLNVKTGVLDYCNAAHTFPCILTAAGKITSLKSTHGLPLGLYSDKSYEQDQIIMDNNDTIILYTDGVEDLTRDKNYKSGSIWIKKNLIRMQGKSPREIVTSLDVLLEGKQLNDDVCLFAVKFTP